MSEVESLALISAADAAARIGRGELSPVVLTEGLLKWINHVEPSVHAWATVDRKGALEQARNRERAISSRSAVGPLHGVPVGIKDIFYTRGLRTSAGSPLLRDFVPLYDATAVALLRSAGAIVLGKTVTTEFATGDPSKTRNAWNPAHTPGGSSSGSAVAVATGMCPVAIGSQTGGSVLRPAAYNGVVGFKPTYGLVSRYGMIPVSWSLDTVGFFARSVRDASLMLDSLTQRQSQQAAGVGTRRALRIGLVEEFFFDRACAEVVANTVGVVERLAAAGAEIATVKVPSLFFAARTIQMVIDHVECAAYHAGSFRSHQDEYGPSIRKRITTGLVIPGLQYVQAQRLRCRLQSELNAILGGFDVLLTPTIPEPAPEGLDSTGDPAFQSPWSLSGVPTITLPSGLSTNGLPLGIQLIAGTGGDRELLDAATWCESVLGVSLETPLLKTLALSRTH